MTGAQVKSIPAMWNDDRLGRWKMAAFLSNLVDAQARSASNGLVFALDAEWGAGKTFFVERWSRQLAAEGLLTVQFNAWENDFVESALEGFYGELKSQIINHVRTISTVSAIKIEAEEVQAKLSKKLLAALVPGGKYVLKQVIERGTKISVDHLWDIFESGDGTKKGEDSTNAEATTIKEEDIERIANKAFEEVIDAVVQQKVAIREFRQELTKLVEIACECADGEANKASNGCIYVFIDELDRCRPTYAIKLLEAIKHLFMIPRLIFIVSTNLHQLANATQAVYGPNFDGFMYLKRFFDFEFTLPKPNREQYIRAIYPEIAKSRKAVSGIPLQSMRRANGEAVLIFLADAAQLDLRTIQRVINIGMAAIVQLPASSTYVAFWLWVLAITRYKNPNCIKLLLDKNISTALFIEEISKIFKDDKLLVARQMRTGEYPYLSSRLIPLLELYKGWSDDDGMALKSMYTAVDQATSYNDLVALEIGRIFENEEGGVATLQDYYQLIEYAGYLEVE